MGLNCGQFGIGAGGKLRLKTVLDHGGVGRGNKIEVQRLGGLHEDTAPFEANSKATTAG
jgi:hypothetical protein